MVAKEGKEVPMGKEYRQLKLCHLPTVSQSLVDTVKLALPNSLDSILSISQMRKLRF